MSTIGVEKFLDKLDKKGIFGNYYTGDDNFDKLAKEWNQNRPKFNDFKGIYEDEEIATDKQTVKNIEGSTEYIKERAPEAVSVEYSFMEGFHNSAWLGEGVSITPASEFDDKVNSLDAVASISRGGSDKPIYLGLDFTTSQELAVINNKMGRTLKSLRSKSLSEAKYYIDDINPDIKGKLNLPRVVIGVDSDMARELMANLSRNRNYQLPEEIKKQIIQEINLQLTYSTIYLLKRFFNKTEVLALKDAKDVLNYFVDKKDDIKKIDEELYNTIIPYIDNLEHFSLLEKEKSPIASDTTDFKGGTFWHFLQENHF